jgi:hypothetical protein
MLGGVYGLSTDPLQTPPGGSGYAENRPNP